MVLFGEWNKCNEGICSCYLSLSTRETGLPRRNIALALCAHSTFPNA